MFHFEINKISRAYGMRRVRRCSGRSLEPQEDDGGKKNKVSYSSTTVQCMPNDMTRRHLSERRRSGDPERRRGRAERGEEESKERGKRRRDPERHGDTETHGHTDTLSSIRVRDSGVKSQEQT